jgi:hypothetical protein
MVVSSAGLLLVAVVDLDMTVRAKDIDLYSDFLMGIE